MAMPLKEMNNNLVEQNHIDANEQVSDASLHFKLEATKQEPFVHFDPEVGILEIKGRSVPEDSHGFYRPILDRLRYFVENSDQGLMVSIHLDYFNTSSSRNLLELMHHLERMHAASRQVVINWIFDEEDDDLLHAGIDFSSIIKVPFVMFSCNNDGVLTQIPDSDWKDSVI